MMGSTKPTRGQGELRCRSWAFWGAVLSCQLFIGLFAAGSFLGGMGCPTAAPQEPASLRSASPERPAAVAPAEEEADVREPAQAPQSIETRQVETTPSNRAKAKNSSQLEWALISMDTACEGNAGGITRFFGKAGYSIASCKTKCEESSKKGHKCMAIDFFRTSGWCSLYEAACKEPFKKEDGASSWKLQAPGSGGGAAGGPAASKGPAPKTDVYAVLAVTPDHYKSEDDLILRALYLKCSAMCHGSRMPFHLIWGGFPGYEGQRGRLPGGAGAKAGAASSKGGEMLRDLQVLRDFGWNIVDYADKTRFLQGIYLPVYSEEEAKRKSRWWQFGVEVQERKDGWATYFKFFAWKAQGCDRVLVVDLDVFFDENPDPWVDAIPANTSFMASPEGKNGRLGINSHMMLLQPSEEVFDELVRRAKFGEYIPWTNTEQDILETTFVPSFVAKRKMKEVVPHAHTVLTDGTQCKRPGAGWPPKTCSDVLKMCDFSKTTYWWKADTLSQCKL